MARAGALAGLVAACLALPAFASAAPPPLPDPNAVVDLLPRPCAYEGGDPYEAEFYAREGWPGPDYERYPGACQRLRLSYGPIVVKPGQNDVLVGPVTIEKPLRDGYITRFEPNLVRADGSVPPVEHVHLHHGTWVSVPDYGSGPFFAAGEEKTIAPFPKGYGLPVKATDQWLLLYMVHSAITQPMEVFITYDIDFVPQAKGEELGLKDAYPIWLDVRPSGYPVFNVQRDYGGADGECTWPKEECASFDPWGKQITGQGEPGNGEGTDWDFPSEGESLGQIESFTGGTLIGIGGHLHPGGLRNEIDLIRPGRTPTVVKGPAVARRKSAKRRAARRKGAKRRKATRCKRTGKRKARARRGAASVAKKRKPARRRCARRRKRKREVVGDTVRIYTGQAAYWDHDDPSRPGGPPTSWDLSMEVTGLPYWGVHVEPGDILRSNATYDTRIHSTYENMGIAVALLVPDGPDGTPGAPGIDPFKTWKDRSESCRSGGLQSDPPQLCDKGIVTHGHMVENGNHSQASGEWNAGTGSPAGEVLIGDFLYTPGDLTTLSMTGVPTVKLGSTLSFTNLEGALIYHTVTSCGFPCLGRTSASFPLSNGSTSTGRPVDFDSSELGIGLPSIGPAKQELSWELPVTPENGFAPGEVVTYFCRIHPSMRGAFEVTQ